MMLLQLNHLPKLLLVGFVCYDKPWKHFERKIDEYILYIIKSGDLYIEEEDVRYHLQKGDVLLLESNKCHSGYLEASCEYYYIHLKHLVANQSAIDTSLTALTNHQEQDRNTYFLNQYFKEPVNIEEQQTQYLFSKNFHITDSKQQKYIFQFINDMIYLYQRNLFQRQISNLKLVELLMLLSRQYVMQISQLSSRKSKVFATVQALQDYIHREYMNRLTSDVIAAKFYMNYDYLNRIFKQHIGFTIAKYINKLKIQQAQQLLLTSELPLHEIGYLVGIDDPYYFSKLFKQYTGITASQYVKDIQKKGAFLT